MLTESKYLSRIIWGAGFLLVAVAFIIPATGSDPGEGTTQGDAPLQVFDESVQAFEERLYAGASTADDAEVALEYAPFIKARALAHTGALSQEEITRAARQFRTSQGEIAALDDPNSREQLRRHRTSMILDEIQRIDTAQAHQALQEVRDAYETQFQIDPGLMSGPDD